MDEQMPGQFGAMSPMQPQGQPVLPAQALDENTEPPRRGVPRIVILLVTLIVLVGAYGAAAYFFKLWPFQRSGLISKQLAFAGAMNKLLDITSVQYEVNIAAKVQPRAEGAKPFDLKFPELDEEKARYERDADRFRSLNNVLTNLSSYHSLYKKYPASLDDLVRYGTSQSTFDGSYSLARTDSSDGTDFVLQVTFETDAAIQAIRGNGDTPSGVNISGRSVTFSTAAVEPYARSYYFYANPPAPGWVSFVENQDRFLSYVPAEFAASVVLGGTAQRDQDAKADFTFHGGVTWSMGDFSGAADAEIAKKGEIFYGRINKMPAFGFFDIAKIKGKWVKITPDDLIASEGFNVSSILIGYSDEGNKKFAQVLAQLQIAFKLLQEEKVLIVDFGAPDEKVGDRTLYVYPVSLDETKVALWYQRLADELARQYGPDALLKLDDSTLTILKSESFQKYLAYIKNTNQLRIAVDAQTGYPVRFTYDSRFIPSDTVMNLRDKEIASTYSVTLSNVNEPISVQEPAPYMTYEEAYRTLTGQTKEVYQFKKQVLNITAIRGALRGFQQYTGMYPDSLSELQKPRKDLPKKQAAAPQRAWWMQLLGFPALAQVSIDFPTDFPESQSFPEDEYYQKLKAEQEKKLEETPFMRVIPKDVFTGQSYGYESSKNDYRLTYQMKLPPRAQKESGEMINYTDYLNEISVSEVVAYIEGENLATAESTSLEAERLIKLDTDADGLPDPVEMYFGSNISADDSDGDGYKDCDEVASRYDPTGPGKLDYSSYYYPNCPSQRERDNTYYAPQQSTTPGASGSTNSGQSASFGEYPFFRSTFEISIMMSANYCQQKDQDLQYAAGKKCDGGHVPAAGVPYCEAMSSAFGSDASWESLGQVGKSQDQWMKYTSCNSDKEKRTFSYGASDGTCVIQCTEKGCTFTEACDK